MRLLFVQSILLSALASVFFYVPEGESKCFIENAPQHFVISMTYNNIENPGSECSLLIEDYKHRPMFSHAVTLDNPTGKVAYMTEEAGEHFICIKCNKSGWFSGTNTKWSLKVDLGQQHSIETQNAAQKDHVSIMEASIKKVIDRVDSVSAENEYEKVQEQAFQTATQSVASRVRWSNILQLIAITGCAAFQVIHLLKFFHNQKIF